MISAMASQAESGVPHVSAFAGRRESKKARCPALPSRAPWGFSCPGDQEEDVSFARSRWKASFPASKAETTASRP